MKGLIKNRMVVDKRLKKRFKPKKVLIYLVLIGTELSSTRHTKFVTRQLVLHVRVCSCKRNSSGV